jgi:hypothetical protein
MQFGKTQNKLLLGNRQGLSLQVKAGSVPTAPLQPFYLEVGSLTGTYMTNSLSWTMDGTGIIMSVEGLYWGIAGTN